MNERNKKIIIILSISIVPLALSYFHHDTFWVIVLCYGLFIYTLLNNHFSTGLRRAIEVGVWVAVLVALTLLYMANHNYPKGPMYSTGEYICGNDDQGPCREEYIEDTSNLNVPVWVKFFKSSAGDLLGMGLFVAGIVASIKARPEGEN